MAGNQPSDLAKTPGVPQPEIEPAMIGGPQVVEAPGPEQVPTEQTPQDPTAAQGVVAPGGSFSNLSTEDLIAQYNQLDTQERGLEDQMTPMAGEDDERPIGVWDEMKARGISSLGTNPGQTAFLLQKTLGKDFEITLRGHNILFKKKGSKKWHPVDREGFEGGVREILGDVADLAGMGTSIAGNVAGKAAGGLLGSAAGPAGTIAGALAGGGMGETALREAAMRAFDEASGKDEIAKELVWNTGIDAATLGMGFLIKPFVKKGVEVFKEVVEDTPMRRVEQHAAIRQSFEEIVHDVGGKTTKTGGEIGESVRGAIDHLEENLLEQVKGAKSYLQVKYAGKKVPAANYLGEIKKQLSDLGIDETLLSKMNVDKGIKNEVLRSLAESRVYGNPKEGMKHIELLLKDYNNMITRAEVDKAVGPGLGIQELFNNRQFWRGRGDFVHGQSGAATERTEQLARDLRRALTQDAAVLSENALRNTPQEGSFKKAMKEYSDKIDTIEEFKTLMNRKKSVELITDAMFETDGSNRIKDLKFLLGEKSPQYEMVKQHWMNKIYDKAIDPKTGVIQGQKLEAELKAYGKNVVNEILTPREQLAMRFVAKQAEKISYLDILSGSQAVQTVKDAAQTVALGGKNPGPLVRMFWNLTNSNAKAAKYLADEGLLKIAKDVKDPLIGDNVLKAASYFKQILDASDVVVKDGREVLKIREFDDIIKDRKVMKEMGITPEEFLSRVMQTDDVLAKPMLGPQPGSFKGAIGATLTGPMKEMRRMDPMENEARKDPRGVQ
jgi:hypothetical protein